MVEQRKAVEIVNFDQSVESWKKLPSGLDILDQMKSKDRQISSRAKAIYDRSIKLSDFKRNPQLIDFLEETREERNRLLQDNEYLLIIRMIDERWNQAHESFNNDVLISSKIALLGMAGYTLEHWATKGNIAHGKQHHSERTVTFISAVLCYIQSDFLQGHLGFNNVVRVSTCLGQIGDEQSFLEGIEILTGKPASESIILKQSNIGDQSLLKPVQESLSKRPLGANELKNFRFIYPSDFPDGHKN